MFRKIVSNIAFSPALVGQLSFYAKRLRREELTRRLGLIFTVMALVVQSLAVFSPPEAVNASSSADFVRGGVSSVGEFLQRYDRNENNIKSIYDSLGIKRSEIAKAKRTVIGESSRYNWSMTSLYSYADGQRSWDYGKGNAFYRPMRLTQTGGDSHPVFASYSQSMGWFAIKIDCGNLITDKPPHPPKPVAACKNLNVEAVSSTRFKFNGKASRKDGATISSYRYSVTQLNGKNVDYIISNNKSTTDTTFYKQVKPGSYKVQLTVRTSTGLERNSDCRGKFTVAEKPDAQCKAVQASIQNKTLVSLAGSASTQNGAKVKSYTFVIKDSSGKVIKLLKVSSSRKSVSAPNYKLDTPGKYTVSLTVQTSVGSKTDKTDCVRQFRIEKTEVCDYNPSLPVGSPDCQPCPDNPDVWIKDENCATDVINTKTGMNLTQGDISASQEIAKAGDKISYTVNVENRGILTDNVAMKESLKDVLEYTTLVDNGGGIYNKDTQTLDWGTVELTAGEKESRTFVVQLMNPVPLTNTGVSDEASYDCSMVNTFGNTVEVAVDCAPEKEIVESVVTELPKTGPGENLLFAGMLLSVVVFFYARSRQLGKEVRLIRKNVHAGAI